MKKILLLLGWVFIGIALVAYFIDQSNEYAIIFSVVASVFILISLLMKSKNKDLEFDNPDVSGANKSVNEK